MRKFVVCCFAIVLVFSSCARVNTPQIMSPESVEAVNAAERDARDDTNRFLWFAVSTVALPVCVLGGYAAGHYLIEPHLEAPGYIGIDWRGGGEVFGLIVGYCVYIFTLNRLVFAESKLPTDRLIGKSPEYVEAYLAAYKKEVQEARGKSALGGCLLGCVLTGVIGEGLGLE